MQVCAARAPRKLHLLRALRAGRTQNARRRRHRLCTSAPPRAAPPIVRRLLAWLTRILRIIHFSPLPLQRHTVNSTRMGYTREAPRLNDAADFHEGGEFPEMCKMTDFPENV